MPETRAAGKSLRAAKACGQPQPRLPHLVGGRRSREDMCAQTCDILFMQDDAFTFNGLDGSTGGYLLPPMSVEDVATLARRRRGVTPWGEAGGPSRGVSDHIDPRSLAESGWAVLFAHDADPALREALRAPSILVATES